MSNNDKWQIKHLRLYQNGEFSDIRGQESWRANGYWIPREILDTHLEADRDKIAELTELVNESLRVLSTNYVAGAIGKYIDRAEEKIKAMESKDV